MTKSIILRAAVQGIILVFVQFLGLISCVRHLSVRSIVMPVSDSEDSGMEDETTETCQEQDCQECKRKLQVALLDTLPHPVGSGMWNIGLVYSLL